MSSELTSMQDAVDAFRTAAEELPGHARFSDEEVEGLYATGCHFFSQGQFDKAVHFYSISVMYRPTQARYLMGLGICQKKLRQHDRAAQAFALALSLEPEQVEPALHVVECLLSTGRKEQASRLLDTLTECLRLGATAKQGVHDRAQALRELLSRP